jgi:hypothetical protein
MAVAKEHRQPAVGAEDVAARRAPQQMVLNDCDPGGRERAYLVALQLVCRRVNHVGIISADI